MRSIIGAVMTAVWISFAATAQQTVLIPAGNQTESFTGLKVTYDENGAKTAEIEFLAGKAEGKINRFHTNGELRETGYYLAGKKHGSWSNYDENGKLISTAHFNNGHKDGEWLVWDNQGNLRYKLTYKNGEAIGEWAMYDEHGKVKERKAPKPESTNVQGK